MLNAIKIYPPKEQPMAPKLDNPHMTVVGHDDFENMQPLEQMDIDRSTTDIVKRFTELGQETNVFHHEGNVADQSMGFIATLPATNSSVPTGLLCSYHSNTDRFTFYDVNGRELGFFTTEQTIKYIGHVYDNEGKFLTHLDDRLFKDSKQFIKQFVFRIKYNNDDHITTFDFHDYTTSGFMSDVELLIKFNSSLDKYKREKLASELCNLSNKCREQIERHINQFIFLLLNYTLKLINIVSDSIPNDRTNLSNKLMQYSIGIMHRISTFVQSQLRQIHDNTQEMSKSQEHSLKIKNELKQKVEQLLSHVQKQSAYFDQLNLSRAIPQISFNYSHPHSVSTK